jgi:acetyl-CoA carboxylase carboxyl transferase subunit alpha
MLQNKLIDGVIPEPLGGAHMDIAATYDIFKQHLVEELQNLVNDDPDKLVQTRIEKFSLMGDFIEG